MKKHYFTVFIYFFSFVSILAQPLKTAKLDSLFDLLESNNKFMGSVALSENGKLIYQKSVGFLDIENDIKANENTKYRIGSISKMFTAVLVFQALEEGKLKLDDKIASFFPTIENAQAISIDNLLNHKSGIHNFTNKPDYLAWATETKSENEMIEIIKKGGSDFKPNSKSQYSNSNYVLLSFILEKVYKKDFARLVSEKITQPIGLKHTYVGSKINPSKGEAFSYKLAENRQKDMETDMSVPKGAGAMVSTPSDLNKFIEALFAHKLISQESLSLMTSMENNYGRGCFQFPFNEKKAFGHTGGIDSFSSFLGHFPAEKVSITLISNGSNYDNNQIMIYMLSAYFQGDFQMPEIQKAIETQADDLAQYLGVYASKDIPLKLTFTLSGNTLIGQATGQPSFPLEKTGSHLFAFSKAGVVLQFEPENKTVSLKQGGGTYKFELEKSK